MEAVRMAVFAGAMLVALMLASLWSGCDLIGSGEAKTFDVPPKRLAAMTAVYEETVENSNRPVQRLVVIDTEDPANYKVLSKAGPSAVQPCFGPEKRRLLYEDHVGSITARSPIKLYDLEADEARPLYVKGAGDERELLMGNIEGCVWAADGSGFFFTASGMGGLTYSKFYDLEHEKALLFAQSQTGATAAAYGLKGRDSVLVLSTHGKETRFELHNPFYFADFDTGEYIKHIENEYLLFVPRENSNRSGWKRAVYTPALDASDNWIAFQLQKDSPVEAPPEGFRYSMSIAVTNITGDTSRIYTSGTHYDTAPRWGPRDRILFDRAKSAASPWTEHQVMVIDTETGDVSELIVPEEIDGVVGLRTPDY